MADGQRTEAAALGGDVLDHDAVIGIFPLPMVLMPHQDLPLRIFEPRYKQLVDDCSLDETPFGVCLIDAEREVLGWEGPRLIGTTAEIDDVEELGTNLHIDARGGHRFEVMELIEPAIPPLEEGEELVFPSVDALMDRVEEEGRPAPPGLSPRLYIRARVRWLPELTGDVDPSRWARVAVRLTERVRLICHLLDLEAEDTQRILGRLQPPDQVPDDAALYRLAMSLQPPVDRLQAILEADDRPGLLTELAGSLGERPQPQFEGLRFDLKDE